MNGVNGEIDGVHLKKPQSEVTKMSGIANGHDENEQVCTTDRDSQCSVM